MELTKPVNFYPIDFLDNKKIEKRNEGGKLSNLDFQKKNKKNIF